ncbi:CRISPR-associated endonuclease Cas2 [Pediococcus pentosaceus]|uniref:CRISPR-associated endonuclease Cas2 n=1 Tax=Pediococcus pentosaceus TaxID=1255 RepID=UPI00132FB658|nr:CRISPR-associated endonuclease Cas2 [Pediococcus pentosaceus]KAF0506904.1 CRISPR-associated endonuclease Cas2 [Pediococcus pentosaceus]MBF7139341.1 CRISPR-associated endonuclease Cas2 [Pediococcus pentosaceus]MCM6821036.1 CRISPR-associated endonuclease Cas2 [Pediococcus pentosaceus]
MRLMIMFDLPVETAKQRKQYRQFQKSLINEGFLMIQYSVYMRVCVTKKSATLMENRIKTFLPENGTIQALTLTEKQYNDMHFLVGDRVEDVRNNSDRTVIL